MNGHDLKQFHEILQRKRQEVARGLDALERDSIHSQRDISGYGIHMAEKASIEEELEKSLTFLAGEGDLLTEIDRALDCLERGVYGICERCAEPIGRSRLLAKPFARLCIACRRALEDKPAG